MISVTRKPEQNYIDADGGRLCLRRIEEGFTLSCAKGVFVIGRVSGGLAGSRGDRDVVGSWWWIAPFDEKDRDGYETLSENGYPTVKSILREYGAVDTAP